LSLSKVKGDYAMPRTPLLLALVEDAVTQFRSFNERRRTRRAIDGLSAHLRKDIGWPDGLPDRQRRVPVGRNG
jgi:hypothetical protein